MPPRARHQDDDVDSTVVDIDSRVDLNLDEVEGQTYPPFRVLLGGQTFSLDEPDAGLVIELNTARNDIQVQLALMFDAQWPEVRPLLAGKKKETLLHLTREYAVHFDLDEAGLAQTVTQNRAERRRSRRRR